MPSLPIAEDLDMFGDCPDGLLPCLVATVMYKFIVERTPEALHRGVIVAVALSAHRGSHLGLVYQIPVFMGTVLNPAIRMVNQA